MFLLNLLLALAWMALTGTIDALAFAEGFVLGYIAIRISRSDDRGTNYAATIRRSVEFILFFLWELLKANLRVMYDVLTPTHHMRPAVVAVPLDAESDVEITLLANLVTLTPGTLSLDVSDDRATLYVHTMYVDDVEEFRRQIKEGFERKLLKVLR